MPRNAYSEPALKGERREEKEGAGRGEEGGGRKGR